MSDPHPGLHLGDGVAWLESQPDDSLDGIFSDPPWGVGPDIAGQEVWQDLLLRVLRAGERVVRPHGHILLWYGQFQLDSIFRHLLPLTSLHLNALLTVSYLPHKFYSSYATLEVVFVLSRTRNVPPRGTPCAFPEYRSISHGHSDTTHPCSRNAKTVSAILRDWFAPGDVICDPFAGSDTTGWAAKRLGISCYSFEVDPRMYETALARHSQLDLFSDG
jgi:DNA modification methylase